MLLKLITLRLGFFVTREWNWNLFDALLVGSAISDQVSVLSGSHGNGKNPTFLRVLRLIRLVRVIRIIRVLKVFSGLRVMMGVILSGMISLMWLFMLLSFILFIFSMAFMQGTSDFLRSDKANLHPRTSTKLQFWFGSITQSLLTLLYAIAGVESWNHIERALREISPLYSCLFILCVFFCVFGVLNVVTGVFVDSSGESAKKDRAAMVEREMEQKQIMVEDLKTIFAEADEDCSGHVTWEEFQKHFNRPEVQAYMSVLELRTEEAEKLFNLLDDDGEGSISIDEFLSGVMRLKGGARKIDHMLLMDRIERVHKEIRMVNAALEAGAKVSPATHRQSQAAQRQSQAAQRQPQAAKLQHQDRPSSAKPQTVPISHV